jgi:hypothetical protein
MHTISGTDGLIHLMDPFNDPSIANPINASVVTESYKQTFDSHYKTKIPFGVYIHPVYFPHLILKVWLSSGINGIPDGADKLDSVNEFLDYAMAQDDVWMVTNSQLIEYMKNPVSAAELGSQSYMACPAVPTGICNGGAGSPAETCALSEGSFQVCYTFN